jgi:hypothetical protein
VVGAYIGMSKYSYSSLAHGAARSDEQTFGKGEYSVAGRSDTNRRRLGRTNEAIQLGTITCNAVH